MFYCYLRGTFGWANQTISDHRAHPAATLCACFVQHSVPLCVFFSSSSLVEMEKWMEDVKMAIEMAKTSNGPSSELLTSSLTDNSKLVQNHTAEREKLDFVIKKQR